MIEAASISISKEWAKNGIISEEDTDVYRYGLELLISTLFNLIAIVCISVVVGYPLMFIPYLLAFITLRLYGGGYHAKKHWTCISFNALVYFMALLIMPRLPDYVAATTCIVVSVVSLCMFWLYSPVQAKNKPLSENERVRNRRISLALTALFLLASIVLSCINLLSFQACRMFFCGESSATILLILEKASSRKNV